MKKIKVILIGAGNRGTTYARHAFDACPEIELVAVADPNPVRRNHIKEKFGLPESACFEGWKDILALEKFADAAIIATQDQMHFEPAMKAIELGYHLLLEKPAAPTPEECYKIADAANKKGVSVIICHVLRFTPFFTTLKRIIDEGKIGKVMNINHYEGVGHIHYSHSFTRGNWHKESDSSPMLLAKSCHDIDILQWLVGEKCTRVHSFGTLSHFCAANKPEGAPEYCYMGCPAGETCPYNAEKIYACEKSHYISRAADSERPTKDDVRRVLTETNYGRCVYQCDNDVVDHQVVNLEYESGATVSFNMSAFNEGGRRIHIMGTKGEIYATMKDKTVTLYEFETGKKTDVPILDAITNQEITGGHGGGDRGIMRALTEFLCGTYNGNALTDISTSVANHLTVFAAEQARREGRVVTVEEYIEGLKD
ncbi:MAG: Gfo/Idh/MocA family oxidoreductase [Clostridia bacterium]|nr:Gfo/Idh/MocA family oxidoreductase [Clostridia bacterium]